MTDNIKTLKNIFETKKVLDKLVGNFEKEPSDLAICNRDEIQLHSKSNNADEFKKVAEELNAEITSNDIGEYVEYEFTYNETKVILLINKVVEEDA